MAKSKIIMAITYLVQIGAMGFASYLLYLGLMESSLIRPQACLYIAICLFVVLCTLDMIITNKDDLALEEE